MAYKNTAAKAMRKTGQVPFSADATGRSRMATDFFNAATLAAKFGTDSLTTANLQQLIQDGAFSAAAASRALFADRFMTFDKVALRTVEAHTTGDTLAVLESGSVHTNTGASGTITIALPAAAVGLEYFFRVGAAQELRIDPDGTETISLPSTGVPGAAGKYLVADAIGETVHLVCCVAGSWSVFGFTGTWSAEA